MMHLPVLWELDESIDLLVPDYTSWNIFIRETGLMELYNNHDQTYTPGIAKVGEKYNYILHTTGENGIKNAQGYYDYGYILRFNTPKDKLAFLIKWS
jgi:hypothetical protein